MAGIGIQGVNPLAGQLPLRQQVNQTPGAQVILDQPVRQDRHPLPGQGKSP